MRDHCRETPVGAADGAVPFPKMRTECQCQANDEPRKRNVRSGVESAASMPIALQRTCHVFPLPVGRSRVASFVEVYAPSNRPQPLGDSRNAGASLAERLLGGPAGSAEKRVLRAGKRQGLDVAARCLLLSRPLRDSLPNWGPRRRDSSMSKPGIDGRHRDLIRQRPPLPFRCLE